LIGFAAGQRETKNTDTNKRSFTHKVPSTPWAEYAYLCPNKRDSPIQTMKIMLEIAEILRQRCKITTSLYTRRTAPTDVYAAKGIYSYFSSLG
jgi:hypothetical protein